MKTWDLFHQFVTMERGWAKPTTPSSRSFANAARETLVERPKGFCMAHSTMAQGQLAEGRTSELYEIRGFTIEERNFRFGRYEIDIIARKGGLIVFVEVKSRRSIAEALLSFLPEQQVRIAHAAAAYLKNVDYKEFRFDLAGFDQHGRYEILENIDIAADSFDI